LKGRVKSPFYAGFKAFQKTFNDISVMASLIEGDYKNASDGVKTMDYKFVSYIAIGDFPETSINFDQPRNDIMIGHAGSPILNHYEALQQLSQMNFAHHVLVPLSYGKTDYITALKNKVESSIKNLDIEFQTSYLAKDEYYRKIESVGYFVLNSYCQQALGNIFFFLWTGTKVFVRKETSTYQTLKAKSFHIYSVEDDFFKDGLVPMTKEEQLHNRKLTEEMIGDERVKQSWLTLLNL
jgi:hypothetical protein